MNQWQVRFDGGRQQRYLPSRADVIACVLRISAHSQDPTFEVFSEAQPVRLADGTHAGRRFQLVEVIDMREPDKRGALQRELGELEVRTGPVEGSLDRRAADAAMGDGTG